YSCSNFQARHSSVGGTSSQSSFIVELTKQVHTIHTVNHGSVLEDWSRHLRASVLLRPCGQVSVNDQKTETGGHRSIDRLLPLLLDQLRANADDRTSYLSGLVGVVSH